MSDPEDFSGRSERWERRARKRDAARRRMRVSGRGLITVLSALEQRRERERREKESRER